MMQRHHLVGEQPERPAAFAVRRRRTGNFEEPGFLAAIQQSAVDPFGRSGFQSQFKTVLRRSVAGPVRWYER